MSLNKSLLLQKQVRDNAEDVQSFLRDLDCWEKDMKKKEEELKLSQLTDEKDLPPIRNSSSRSKSRSKHKKLKEKTSNPPKKRLSSYDYQSWEKFDVEKELKEIDDDDKEGISTSGDSDAEEQLNIQKRKQLAIIKKDKGNDFFKKGQYDSAINTYTIGMELDPENPLIAANRAMAFLKKEQFQAAENDCSLCLSLDSSYVKAYLRRGVARLGLNKLSLAKEDFQNALQLEPENKQALKEIDLINQKIKKSENLSNGITEVSYSKSESNLKCSARVEKDTALSELEIHPVELASCQKIGKSTGDNSDVSSFDNSFLTNSTSKEDNITQELMTEIEVSNLSLEEFKKVVERERLVSSSSAGAVDSGSQVKDISKPSKSECDDDGIQKVISALEQQLPPVPTASFQFLTDWKKMAKYPELRYQYLKQFPPEKLLVLFKNYMEPELFPEIIKTLSSTFIENGDDVFEYVKNLTSVGRFTTMVMFLSKEETKDLKKLKDYLELSPYPVDEVKAVIQRYGI